MEGYSRYDDPATFNTGAGVNGDYYDMGSYEFKGYLCKDTDNDNYYSLAGCGTEVDCDDSDALVNPDVAEVCDDRDNNCDGLTDEVCGNVDGDDCIGMDDVLCLYQWVIGSPDNCLENIDVPSCHSCDVDGNGSVDIMDVLCLHRRIRGNKSCLDSADVTTCN